MKLLDVNVLVQAHRDDLPQHAATARWLAELAEDGEPFGASELVLSSFLRIVTNARIFKVPTALEVALNFIANLRAAPKYVQLAPGPRHWPIFTKLLRATNASGNLVSDAYHAALAIETGTEWISADRDFARFPELKWRNPFKEA